MWADLVILKLLSKHIPDIIIPLCLLKSKVSILNSSPADYYLCDHRQLSLSLFPYLQCGHTDSSYSLGFYTELNEVILETAL